MCFISDLVKCFLAYEMLYTSNAQTATRASAARTRIHFRKQMLFRSVSPVSFFFYYFMTGEMCDILYYILNVMQRSHNAHLFHVNTPCSIVLRKIYSSYQTS